MDIKELALKVAKEMNWRMDEMTLETFATRLIAAYTDGQEPVAWVPQFSWQRSIDAVACISKRSFDDIPLFTAPPEPAPKQKFPAKPAGPEDQKIYDSIAANYAKGAATSSDEVREMVERLCSPTEPYGYQSQLACEAADALESLEQQVAALTKERDELKISNAFAHGEWRAVKDQLAAALAREAKLRELWEVVEKEYFARLKEQDEEAAKFEAEKDMYGWNFHKGLRGGLVEFHIYMTKIVKALALPTDDSALMERLKQEYERGYADAAEILTGVDRSMT